MAAVAGLAIGIGGWVFLAAVLGLVLLMAWEWVGLTGAGANRFGQTLLVGLVPVLLTLIVFLNLRLMTTPAWLPLVELALLGAALILLWYRAFMPAGLQRRWAWLGVGYIALPAAALIVLREPDGGLDLVVWLVLVVIATDSLAYAAGRSLGGPKLAPRISPNKTWAGFAGGMVGAALVGGVAASLLAWPLTWPPLRAALLAALLAAVAQLGDLFESWLKRRAGVKDSGHIIPGHGGVLDRLDGYLFAAPVFAIVIALERTN